MVSREYLTSVFHSERFGVYQPSCVCMMHGYNIKEYLTSSLLVFHSKPLGVYDPSRISMMMHKCSTGNVLSIPV